MKHKLLLRQIKKYLGGLENIPPQWEGFLNAVDDAYHTNDDDYALLEHTMDVSAVEILEKGTKIEWLSRLPDETPHPVLRISKEGELLYFNQASLKLLQLSNAGPSSHYRFIGKNWPVARLITTPIERLNWSFPGVFFLSLFLLLTNTTT